MRQYCEKQEKEIVEEEEVEESINKLTTFNLNTRKESEQEAKSALVKNLLPFIKITCKNASSVNICSCFFRGLYSSLQQMFQVLPFYTDEQKRVAGIGEQQVNNHQLFMIVVTDNLSASFQNFTCFFCRAK